MTSENKQTEAHERDAFESWAKGCGYQRDELERFAIVSPYYFNPHTEQAWQAWQARAALATPQAQTADAPIEYLQEADQHLLHRFIETTEDDESFDIGKDAVKRLANLGVVESCGFGWYGVTMFGYWVHEHFWHQNPSLPLKTNADRDRERRVAMDAAQGPALAKHKEI